MSNLVSIHLPKAIKERLPELIKHLEPVSETTSTSGFVAWLISTAIRCMDEEKKANSIANSSKEKANSSKIEYISTIRDPEYCPRICRCGEIIVWINEEGYCPKCDAISLQARKESY